MFAARAYNKVNIAKPPCVKAAHHAFLINILYIKPALLCVQRNAFNGVHRFRAAAVIKGNIQLHRGHALGAHLFRQRRNVAHGAYGNVVFMQILYLFGKVFHEYRKQRIHLYLWTFPVFGGKGIEGKRLYAQVAAEFDYPPQPLRSRPVAHGTRQAAPRGVAAVAVHYYANMLGQGRKRDAQGIQFSHCQFFIPPARQCVF